MVIGEKMEILETSDSIKIEGQQEQNRSETTNQSGANIVKSLSAVGRHFKVSQPAVSKWKVKGMPVEDDGSYNLTRIAAWRALTVAREAESLEKVEGVDSEVLAEVKRELVRFRSLGEIYKLERADVFASAQAKLLSLAEEILDGIKSKDLKKMHVRDKIKALKDIVSSVGSLYQSERLEKGESTENVAVLIQAIKESRKRMKAEEEKNRFEAQNGNQSN